ncbi:hypothetical protein L9F63_004015, partial [Diploptera punctata]
ELKIIQQLTHICNYLNKDQVNRRSFLLAAQYIAQSNQSHRVRSKRAGCCTTQNATHDTIVEPPKRYSYTSRFTARIRNNCGDRIKPPTLLTIQPFSGVAILTYPAPTIFHLRNSFHLNNNPHAHLLVLPMRYLSITLTGSAILNYKILGLNMDASLAQVVNVLLCKTVVYKNSKFKLKIVLQIRYPVFYDKI